MDACEVRDGLSGNVLASIRRNLVPSALAPPPLNKNCFLRPWQGVKPGDASIFNIYFNDFVVELKSMYIEVNNEKNTFAFPLNQMILLQSVKINIICRLCIIFCTVVVINGK